MSLPVAFVRDAERLIPEDRRFTDALSTLAFGTDASFYRLTPKLVIRVRLCGVYPGQPGRGDLRDEHSDPGGRAVH